MNTKLNAMTVLATVVFMSSVVHAGPTPGYNNKIPQSIMTPDRVLTRIGTLELFDGLPSRQTTQKVYDNLDFMRAVQVFLDGTPATSLEAMRRGMAEAGATQPYQIIIFSRLMDSNPIFLTGNTDTVYTIGIFDMERDGPTVIEVPAGSGPGTINDAWFRFVVDMGIPGPDKGKGGKYLLLPPGYEGDVPEGYFVARLRSYVHWMVLRGFLVDGKPDAATEMFKKGLNVYPLKAAKNPPKMQFITGSQKTFNTIHANTAEFYEELDHVIQKEPIDMIDPQTRGLIAAIGIEKGKRFRPDKRMKAILVDAAAVGNATARAIVLQTREKVTVTVDGKDKFQGTTSEISHKAEDIFAWLETMSPIKSGSVIGFGTIPDCTGLDHDDFIDPNAEIEITFDRLGTLRCRFEEPVGKLLPSRWPMRPPLQKYHA